MPAGSRCALRLSNRRLKPENLNLTRDQMRTYAKLHGLPYNGHVSSHRYGQWR
jgi:hypothetical protein